MKRRNWYIITASYPETGEPLLRWPFRERVISDAFQSAFRLLRENGFIAAATTTGKKATRRVALGFAAKPRSKEAMAS